MKSKLSLLVMIFFLVLSMSPSVFAAVTPADGTYSIDVTSNSAMFKVVDAKLNVSSSGMSSIITLSGTGYEKLFIGTSADADAAADSETIPFVADSEGMYTYKIPISGLDMAIDVAAFSTKNQKWYDRTLTFNSNTLMPEEGSYSIDVTSSAKMFKVVAAKLTVSSSGMSSIITLSGTGYEKLFMGTSADAATAADGDTIPFVADSEGMYTYKVPVSALDTGIAVAAFSTKNQIWYDRTLTFNSNTLAAIEAPQPEQPQEEQPQVEQPQTEQPQTEQPKTEQEKVSNPKTGENDTLMASAILLLVCAILISGIKKINAKIN